MNHLKPDWRRLFFKADWVLLLMLLMVTNQAVLSLKFAGILFAYICRPAFRFRLLSNRLPGFYIAVVLLAAVNLVVHIKEYSPAYLSVFAVSCAFWMACLLVTHQVLTAIERDKLAVRRTLGLFTVINFTCTMLQVARMAIITHQVNPFAHLPFPYGMSAGDKVYGAFFELSYCNMMVSALLAIYFLFRRQAVFSLLAFASLLLVFGNVGTLIFLLVLGLCVGTGMLLRKKLARSRFSGVLLPPGRGRVLGIMAAMVVVSYTFISPENYRYVADKLGTKIKRIIRGKKASETDGADIAGIVRTWNYSRYNERRASIAGDTAALASRIATTKYCCDSLAGKKLSYLETKAYLSSGTAALLLGSGPGRFSSLTAERFSGLDSSRLFRKVLPYYCAPVFRDNHRLITATRLAGSDAGLSNANWPHSFYNQLLGEYGLLGALLFLLTYAGYFVRRIRKGTYSIWMTAMMIPFATLTYLFEPLCVMVFFELLLLLDTPDEPQKPIA